MNWLRETYTSVLEHPWHFLLTLSGLSAVLFAIVLLAPAPWTSIAASVSTSYWVFRNGDVDTIFRDIVADRVSVSGVTSDGAPLDIEHVGQHVELDRLLIPARAQVSFGYETRSAVLEITVNAPADGPPVAAQLIAVDGPASQQQPHTVVQDFDSVTFRLTAPSDQVGVTKPFRANGLDFSIVEHQGATSYSTSALLKGKMEFFVSSYLATEHEIDPGDRVEFDLDRTLVEHVRFDKDGISVKFSGRPNAVNKRVGGHVRSLLPSAYSGLAAIPPIAAFIAFVVGLFTAVVGANGFRR